MKVQALFCDDVRRDETGSFIVIGVYPGVLFTEREPVTKLISNFVLITHLDPGEHDARLLMVFRPDNIEEETIVIGDQTLSLMGGEDAALVIGPSGLPLRVPGPGLLELRLGIDECEPTEICTVKVLLHDQEGE